MTHGRDLTATDTDAARLTTRIRPSRTARLAALTAGLLSTPALAATTPTGTPDDRINALFAPIAKAVADVVFYSISLGHGDSMSAMVLWLIVAAACFTVYFRFINVRGFR